MSRLSIWHRLVSERILGRVWNCRHQHHKMPGQLCWENRRLAESTRQGSRTRPGHIWSGELRSAPESGGWWAAGRGLAGTALSPYLQS